MKKPMLAWLLVAALSIAGSGSSPPQDYTCRHGDEFACYFPETGHSVQGPFLAYFEAHDGEALLGFPITEHFFDPHSRLLVQYFQNARLEWHPENPDPYKVLPGLLGDELGKGRPRLTPDGIPSPGNPDCRYFPETGHSVCFAFLEFFRLAGGLDVFGFPISEFDLENGRIVQYFQRARLEWHPERRAAQKVAVGPLGLIHFHFAELDPELLEPARPTSNVIERVELITALRLSPSVARPVMKPDGPQTVYLLVLNQFEQPVEGAQVELTVKYPSRLETYTLERTDTRGVTRLEFEIADGVIGKNVVLDLTVTAGGLTRTASTSFLIWY